MNVFGKKAKEILSDEELYELEDLIGADFEFCATSDYPIPASHAEPKHDRGKHTWCALEGNLHGREIPCQLLFDLCRLVSGTVFCGTRPHYLWVRFVFGDQLAHQLLSRLGQLLVRPSLGSAKQESHDTNLCSV